MPTAVVHQQIMSLSHTVVDEDQVWVTRLQRWGLRDIAPALLEVARPLGPIGAALLTFTSPVLTTFVDHAALDQFAALLADPARLESLRHSLMDKAEH